MAADTICSDFGAPQNKVCHCFHCFPVYLTLSDGTGCRLSFSMTCGIPVSRPGIKPTFPTLQSRFLRGPPGKSLHLILLLVQTQNKSARAEEGLQRCSVCSSSNSSSLSPKYPDKHNLSSNHTVFIMIFPLKCSPPSRRRQWGYIGKNTQDGRLKSLESEASNTS